MRTACFWHQGHEGWPVRVLDHPLEVDFLVIGGGCAGLSAAYFLKEAEPSMSIAVVAPQAIGLGPDGRGSGVMAALPRPQHGEPVPWLDESVLPPALREARAMARFRQEAVAQGLDFLGKQGLDCDLHVGGLLQPAISRRQLKLAMRHYIAFRGLGLEADFWDRDRCARLGVPWFRGAAWNPGAGMLDPAKLLQALGRLAEDRGVQVYEDVRVTGIQPGANIIVDAETGPPLQAGNVLVGSKLPGLEFPGHDSLRTRRTTTIVTRPLHPDLLAELGGWPGRAPWSSLHHLPFLARLTPDQRLLFSLDCGPASQTEALQGRSPAGFQDWQAPSALADRLALDSMPPALADKLALDSWRLRQTLEWFYPALREIPIDFAWQDWTEDTADGSPRVGRTGRYGNIFYAAGFGAHGLAVAHACGPIVRDLFLERSGAHELLPFSRPPATPRFPGKQLRTWLDHLSARLQRSLDGWTNLAARPTRAPRP